MKALLKRSRKPGDMILTDLPVPRPGPGQLLAKVAYAGVCGSDLDILESLNDIYRPPVVQGHEFSAVVSETGEGVSGFSPGDKIVSETLFESCGECQPCLDGYDHLCLHKKIVGWTENGGFADYVLLNSRFVHKLSPEADLKSAALIEPSAISAEAVSVKGRFQPGETAAVVGPGATGLLSALTAKALGAKRVFLIGRQTSPKLRFPIARNLGIEHCIDSSVTDPADYLLKHNDGKLADLVVDSTGNISGFLQALSMVKRNGRLIELGSITTETPFPWQKAAFQAVDLNFVFSSSHAAWAKAVELFERDHLDLKQLATHVYPLEQWQDAMKTAQDSTKSFKVLFQPKG